MQKPTVDELLVGSRQDYTPSPAILDALDRTVLDSRRASSPRRSPRHRTILWLVPGAVLAVGALTAGGVLVDDALHADLPIEITYTTLTGTTVSCTAEIEGGSLFSPRSAAVIDYYQNHDFTGIGQRIYDYAVVLTGDVEATPDVFPASSEFVPEEDSYADAEAFSFSLTSFLLIDTQVALNFSGSGDSWMSSDCTGQLR